jgi:hypothetical protein
VINKQLRDAEDAVVLNGADPMTELARAEEAVNQALAEQVAQKG